MRLLINAFGKYCGFVQKIIDKESYWQNLLISIATVYMFFIEDMRDFFGTCRRIAVELYLRRTLVHLEKVSTVYKFKRLRASLT